MPRETKAQREAREAAETEQVQALAEKATPKPAPQDAARTDASRDKSLDAQPTPTGAITADADNPDPVDVTNPKHGEDDDPLSNVGDPVEDD